jgi:hypothetical protein
MQWIGEGAQFALRHREAIGGRTLCLVLAPRSAKRSVARALPWGSSISAFGTRAAASTSDTTPTARGDPHQPHLPLHHSAQLACQTHAGNNPVCHVSAASKNTCAERGENPSLPGHQAPALTAIALKALLFCPPFPSQGESTAHQETLSRSDSWGNIAWKETDGSVRSVPDASVIATDRFCRPAIRSRRWDACRSNCASSACSSRISLLQSAKVEGKWVGLRLMVLAPATRTLQLFRQSGPALV